MQIKLLKEAFLSMCLDRKLKKNYEQIVIIEQLINFYENINKENSFIKKLFFNKKKKLGFYLYGDVGVGKTMILNFFYDYLDIPKKRMHFNEFMIDVHNFLHENRKRNHNKNLLELYVNNLKKNIKIIYFDEFQVTNIVDAMILGKLFQCIFENNIITIFSSNITIDDLYKDGLQRDQFVPFIKILKNYSVQKELIISEDYRKSGVQTLDRYFFPNDEKALFNINQLFRELTKNKPQTEKIIHVKGRSLAINNFFDGIARFHFNDLCKKNLGAEDFIAIADHCSFLVIDDIPIFSDENINEQQRFLTLIDILYEKKVALMASGANSLELLGSSIKLINISSESLSLFVQEASPNIPSNVSGFAFSIELIAFCNANPTFTVCSLILFQ